MAGHDACRSASSVAFAGVAHGICHLAHESEHAEGCVRENAGVRDENTAGGLCFREDPRAGLHEAEEDN